MRKDLNMYERNVTLDDLAAPQNDNSLLTQNNEMILIKRFVLEIKSMKKFNKLLTHTLPSKI